MTRRRLRPEWSPEALANLYARPHDHTRWVDHRLRVAVTSEVAKWMVAELLDSGPSWLPLVADLSCGDGAVVRSLGLRARQILGDLAPGYSITGPLEQTVPALDGPIDMYVCCETLEHLNDPDQVLKLIREKSRTLLLSTPVDAGDDPNLEHYWSWSRSDVEGMLGDAGWSVGFYTEVDCRPAGLQYSFGIWGAR